MTKQGLLSQKFHCFAAALTNEIQPVNDTDQFRLGDTIVITHATVGVRDAIAFGTLTGGGVSWVPGGSRQAFIALTRSSAITITHQ